MAPSANCNQLAEAVVVRFGDLNSKCQATHRIVHQRPVVEAGGEIRMVFTQELAFIGLLTRRAI